MHGNLSLRQSPPFSVPARFFITAPLFGMFAAMILIVEGGDIFLSRWTPGMLSITHCLVLGFFASIMMGAIQQLLPVVAGAVISRPLLTAGYIHGLWVPGVALLVYALLYPQPITFIIAVVLISASILGFVLAVFISLHDSPSINQSVPGIKMAVASLVITLLMGISLSLGYAGILPLWRPALTNLHLVWGLIGWIGLLIMAMAWQLVPMFQITKSYPRRLIRFTVPTVSGLLIIKSILVLSPTKQVLEQLELLIDLGIVAYLLIFAITTLTLQRQSLRKIRDSHRDFWKLSMINLILSCLLWGASEISGSHVLYLLTTCVFLLGFAMAVVTGMLLKIVSFLIWLHLQAANEGLIKSGKTGFKVPKMKAVISSRKSTTLLLGLILAELSLIAAIVSPDYFSVIAGLLWLSQFSLLTYILARAMFNYNQIRSNNSGKL